MNIESWALFPSNCHIAFSILTSWIWSLQRAICRVLTFAPRAMIDYRDSPLHTIFIDATDCFIAEMRWAAGNETLQTSNMADYAMTALELFEAAVFEEGENSLQLLSSSKSKTMYSLKVLPGQSVMKSTRVRSFPEGLWTLTSNHKDFILSASALKTFMQATSNISR